ncbi:DUF927 domain-containing protein [Streptomyces sp. NPDC015144]|uniref:DUF927 domain-containing protein n=1 Tax=Streptomyces sp. NPDC015144 TaxID=3364944 RepID=UPI0036F89C03
MRTLERGGVPPGCRAIAGMKKGWFYQETTRAILHQPDADGTPTVIGYVPEITATIAHYTDDGEYIRTEFLARGKRQRNPRILSEDELDRGTWAAKCGQRRPTGNDERHAFARIMREEGDKAEEVPARTYYNEAGDLVFPEAHAQTLGYRMLRGTEQEARDAWEEIGYWTTECGKSALVQGAMFAGPVLDSLDVLAHMVNCFGPGQQGKSTILTICAGTFGDIKPRRQQLMITWNASKQGITQSLRQRGFLPLCLDEHSSSGRKIQESSREISQMVAGAIRSMGTADGAPRESDGFWLSCAVSSSNEPLKHEGQTEDLATRLQEFQAPFFPDKMLLADGSPAPAGHKGAEHVSKRLKRLAKGYGGWPLEWAIRKGMFRTENLRRIKERHLELCAKHRPASGGIAATIAELHMVWVVGAYMLGEAIGVPEIGVAAEKEAAARLTEAIVRADEANVPDHEKLWSALDSLRIEKSAFPDIDKLPAAAEEGFRRLRGFLNPETGEWWVVNPVVQEAAVQAGVDNLTAALQALDTLQIHIRGTGKNAQRKLPQSIRKAGLGERMHCFNTLRAAEILSPDDDSEGGPNNVFSDEFPGGATPQGDPGATGVAPESNALTCTGATGATGATPWLFDFSMESDTGSGEEPFGPVAPGVAAPRLHDVTSPVQAPPRPTAPPRIVFPRAAELVEDKAFAALASRATGRTLSATRFGVLGDGVLHLPNREPVKVAVPRSVDDVPALVAAYGLKTLWVHQDALASMGLPTFEERRVLGTAQARAERGLSPEDPVPAPGAMNPVAHPWVVPSPGSPVAAVRPAGLTAWMTLILVDENAQDQRVTVAVPAYEHRFDKAKQPGRGGWGGAETPEVLLDALMVYLMSTLHGPSERPKVVPYFQGPNQTGEDFAGGKGRTEVLCQAIRDGAVPPAAQGLRTVPLMVPQQWHREPTPAERAGGWLHRYDKTAAWLAAYGPTKLGIGEPTHGGEGTQFTKAHAGYWRLADVPGTGPEGLPQFQFREVEGGGYWLPTPSVELLMETYPTWTPKVLESWHWETSRAALSGMYKLMATSRNRIVAAMEEGRPGGKWAKQVHGRIYQSFRGYLSRKEHKTDHATGGDWQKDVYFRPDWAHMLMAHATANLYRNLAKFANEDGRLPLSVYVDAATYVSDSADPTQARPASMQIGSAGGTWSIEGQAPMAELLPLLDDPTHKTGAHGALDRYLSERGK